MRRVHYMNKIAIPLTLLLSTFTLQPASAEILNGKYSGHIMVYSNIVMTCPLNIEVNYNSSLIQMGVCGLFLPFDAPISITRTDNSVTFHNVFMYSATGSNCQGDLSAEWNGTELIFETTLPAVSGPDCQFSGIAQKED